jgi:hypothetical protein
VGSSSIIVLVLGVVSGWGKRIAIQSNDEGCMMTDLQRVMAVGRLG